MNISKEQLKCIQSAINIRMSDIEICIDEGSNNFNEGYNYAIEKYKKSFEYLGKLIEEIEMYGLK